MMTTGRKLILVSLTALSFGAGGDSASAQVFVDPDSPTAKEYAIPLEDARRDASSPDGDGPVAQGDRSAPLFGEGIGGGSEGDGGGGEADQTDNEPAGGRPDDGDDDGAGIITLPQARPITATVPQGGLGDAVTIGALALSVLLLGGVIGSIARRRAG